MFRRKALLSVLTLGMFVGACDVTALYPGVPQPIGFNLFKLDKISMQFSQQDDPPPDPPGGINDPPGTV